MYRLKNNKNLTIEFVNKPLKQHTLVYNDPVRFDQCMSNLLNNAFKFTDNGSIKFGYTLKENNFICYVSDTGIGIAKESDRPHL